MRFLIWYRGPATPDGDEPSRNEPKYLLNGSLISKKVIFRGLERLIVGSYKGGMELEYVWN